MRQTKPIDEAYAALLLDFVSRDVFRAGSPEAKVLTTIASSGFASLDFAQTSLWYERVLPIVSKPLSQQVAVARIVRNGGRVPPRIDVAELEAGDERPEKAARERPARR